MLERTFSFWQRWVGRPKSDADATATATLPDPNGADERRLWVRYPSDLKTSILLAEPLAREQSYAVIRDISRGGANLFLEHKLPAGQLISLELPNAERDGTYTILACIVRCEQESDGHWALGCVFSRELTDEDMHGFGVPRMRHTDKDQRAWVRFDCNLNAEFQIIGDPDQKTESAQVLNLSASGVGLLVDQFLDAGSLLNLEFRSKTGTRARTILACVVRVADLQGRWAVGCNFIRELSEADFHALI